MYFISISEININDIGLNNIDFGFKLSGYNNGDMVLQD